MSRNSKLRHQDKALQRARRAKDRHKKSAQRARGTRWSVIKDAEGLIDRREWSEARRLLERYDAESPADESVLRRLLDVYYGLEDHRAYAACCRRLIALEPENRELHLQLAAALMNDSRSASALQAFRRFVELWPDDPLAVGARDSIAHLMPSVDELLAAVPAPPGERLEFAVMFESLLTCLENEDEPQAMTLGEQLVARCPEFLPARNELSELYYRAGRSSGGPGHVAIRLGPGAARSSRSIQSRPAFVPRWSARRGAIGRRSPACYSHGTARSMVQEGRGLCLVGRRRSGARSDARRPADRFPDAEDAGVGFASSFRGGRLRGGKIMPRPAVIGPRR